MYIFSALIHPISPEGTLLLLLLRIYHETCKGKRRNKGESPLGLVGGGISIHPSSPNHQRPLSNSSSPPPPPPPTTLARSVVVRTPSYTQVCCCCCCCRPSPSVHAIYILDTLLPTSQMFKPVFFFSPSCSPPPIFSNNTRTHSYSPSSSSSRTSSNVNSLGGRYLGVVVDMRKLFGRAGVRNGV